MIESTALDRSTCRRCHTAIWRWHWMGLAFDIDTAPVRTPEAELAHRQAGRMTYTAARRHPGGIEIDFRWRWSIRPDDWATRIILADHVCGHLPACKTWPDYFPAPAPATDPESIEGTPF